MIDLPKQLLVAALSELRTPKARDAFFGNSKTTKTYATYLAALGPSMRQIGLIPTLSVYATQESDGDEDKSKLLDYLQALLCNAEAGLLPDTVSGEIKRKGNLLAYARSIAPVAAPEEDPAGYQRQRHATDQLQRQLERAIMAAKLAFKTYPLGAKDHG